MVRRSSAENLLRTALRLEYLKVSQRLKISEVLADELLPMPTPEVFKP